MTIQEILKKFESKGPPWGDKLTPTASKELEKLLIDFSYKVYTEGYKKGKSDTYAILDERGDS